MGRGVDLLVEAAEDVEEAVGVLLDRLAVAMTCPDQDHQVVGLVEQPVELVELVAGRMPGGEPGGQAAQRDLHLGQVVAGVLLDPGHQRRTRAHPLHEAVELEPPDRLADRGRADAEALGHAALGHLGAGHELAGADLAA